MQRHKGKKPKDKLWRELDAITPQIVKARAFGCCRRCGASPSPQGLHWAHIVGRTDLKLRWNLDNAVALCYGCHRWFHSNPLAFKRWLKQTLPSQMQRLARAQKKNVTVNEEYMRNLLASYKEMHYQL